MSFFALKDDDIINTSISAHPRAHVESNGDQLSGSVYLEKKFLTDPLLTRRIEGFSAKDGWQTEKEGPFTASIDILDAEQNANEEEFYESLTNLYDYYSLHNSNYTIDYDGTPSTNFRVITIPEVYYEREILTGSFSASDRDAAGDTRNIYDDGRGGIYSGSLTGSLVGNIFYSEGFVVLKKTDLLDFGKVSPDNFKWSVDLKGTHKIPVKILRCRAPAGQLNASTNETYYYIPTGSQDDYRNEKVRVLSDSRTYITKVGIYNKNFELVAVAHLAQAVRKDEGQDIMFRIRYDF